MKKRTRILMFLGMVTFSLTIWNSTVQAEEINTTSPSIEETTEELPVIIKEVNFENESVILDTGEEIYFDNKEEFDRIASNQMKRTPGYTYTRTVLKHEIKKNVWVGYCPGTPNWTKASQYTTGQSKSYSISVGIDFDGGRTNLSSSYSWSVNTTIPANSKSFSRLAFYADYDCKKIRFKEYEFMTGKSTGKYFDTKFLLETATYLKPVYK
ncbi:hypothetical protein [Isobaculum melis]|uniref:Uncharacterized protein n=1 Tax=Isobaculum melis TaxID=142588 RepID=A0A1H9SD07_9LACT|nr:hypothetical protein [Isobaculum melis]SER82857.1 hypothetical protein SAMN04488559_10738 [Isobaculum melis]